MKERKFLTSTLFIAAAAMGFGALSARAEQYELGDGDVNLSGVTVGASVTSGTIYEGDVIVVNSSILSSETWGSDGYKGAWIGWSGSPVLGTWTVGSADSKVTITGSGFFGIALRNGNGSYDTTVDLSYADVSNFTGQISVVNVWADNVTVKLSGDQWAGVEYVFGSVTAEWAGVTDSGNGNWNATSAENGLFTRGTGDATGTLKEHDTLELQGDTTLAGVTGTSKDYSTSNGNNYADNDAITVATTGATLTLVGEGEYEFYGTVGAESLELSISMGYASDSGGGDSGESVGSQTFGGTNYLDKVSVNEGTLKLGGTTSIKGSVSVAENSTLELSGSVTLSNTISNSGTISIDDGTTFVLDNLKGGHVSGTLIGYYELVEGNGGSISYDGGSISFSFNGSILDDWNLYVDESGNVWAYGESGEFTWAGTEASHTWNTDTTNTPWAIGTDGDTSYFINGSDVTFGTITDGSPYATVNITESVTAGSIAVNDDYTFVFTDGIKVEAKYVDVATDKTLKLQLAEGATSAEFHMDGEGWYQFFSNVDSRENHGTVDIGAGVTFYLSDSTDSASIGSKNYGAVVTGTGTLSVESTGAIGLYLPDFQGTVIFREGTTIRIGIDNTNYGDVGVYNANATLVFESGSGITIIGNLSDWADTEDKRVTAALVFEDGSHEIATGGHTAEFAGTISGENATITISGAGNLTFSGGGTIGTLTITAGATLVFSGTDKTYTITTIAKSGNNDAGKLEVDSGATVNVGTLNADWYIGTTQVDGVLNISGTAEFGVGAGSTETITGTGTVTVGTLQVGHGTNANNGSTVKIDGGLTFITGEVTTGVVTNNSHIQLGNTTFGTSNENGLIFATTVTDVTLVAGYDEKTTFNTNLYDVSAGGFTTTGTTITISSTVTGDGAMEVTGNGKLILSGTSSLSSVTVDSGATLEIGGTLALSSAIENSGTIIIDDGTTFALDNLGDGYHLDGIGYYEIIDNTSGGTVSFTEGGNYIFTNGDTTLTGWTIVQGSDGNIWIYGVVGSFNWAGDSENHNWSTSSDDKTWAIGDDTGKSAYVEGSDVTFGTITDGYPSSEVNITTDITAGSITVQDDYTFVLSNGVTLEATYIDVLAKEGEGEGNYKLTLSTVEGGSATVLMDSENFYQFFTGDENQGDIEIGEGVTFYLSTLVGNQASVTSASFSITGTGTLSVGATHVSDNGGQIGLYLPDFEGTVIFREGTTYARFGLDNGNYTGVYNASATLVFEAGVGIRIQSDLTVINGDEGDEDHRILASIEFADGSHEIATNGHTAEFAGTVSGEKADITITGAGTLTFSGESVSLGSITFSGTSGNVVTTIEIGAGTTFTVAGNVIDATGNEMIHITLGEESTMIVGGMLEFSPGNAANYDSTISGAGADKSTVVIGELVVGNKDSGTGGSAIEVSNVTLVVGALSFGGGTNSRFDLYLKDSTLGFTKDVTIEQSTVSGSTSIIVLGEYGTNNSTTTGTGTTTTINTSKYDTETGAFTNEGVTVTISQIIYGKGDLVVEGVGKLVLTAANQYTSSTTIKAGATVVVQNESALGTGSVTVNSGGSLELDTHVSVDTASSTVAFAEGAKLILGGDLLDSIIGSVSDETGVGTAVAVITANTITFGDISVSTYSDEESLSSLVNQYVSVSGYELTWTWSDGTLWAVASIPEPSTFGLLLGVSALALTATRRRRRRQYREAA